MLWTCASQPASEYPGGGRRCVVVIGWGRGRGGASWRSMWKFPPNKGNFSSAMMSALTFYPFLGLRQHSWQFNYHTCKSWLRRRCINGNTDCRIAPNDLLAWTLALFTSFRLFDCVAVPNSSREFMMLIDFVLGVCLSVYLLGIRNVEIRGVWESISTYTYLNQLYNDQLVKLVFNLKTIHVSCGKLVCWQFSLSFRHDVVYY